ncbi:MAG TPA: hypothetical protein VD838_06045 [Anaeromyxobacteraceae bacterium]|nr:hypothetical protein [Anaeromyxobacteraceae bacterium]
MRAPLLAALVLAGLLPAAPSHAQDAGPVFTASLGGGAELGLDEGEDEGLAELEATAGWEFADFPVRPEVGLVVGLQPDTHAGFRAGLRYLFPDSPFQLRAAFESSSVRNRDLFYRRAILLGVAAEARITGEFGLFAELDSGIPLRDSAGVPLLFRGGASLRF